MPLVSDLSLPSARAAAGMRVWQTTSKSKFLALWTKTHTLSPLAAASLQGTKLINEEEQRPGLESFTEQAAAGGGAPPGQPGWGCGRAPTLGAASAPAGGEKGCAAQNAIKHFALGSS